MAESNNTLPTIVTETISLNRKSGSSRPKSQRRLALEGLELNQTALFEDVKKSDIDNLRGLQTSLNKEAHVRNLHYVVSSGTNDEGVMCATVRLIERVEENEENLENEDN